ncbi:HtaA domain-containing protein [Streptomyces sp. NPDC005955]|uniref:HtaA domain-containing protein n=1 Tax=Streptomyces sp. NPDC005955 TaxID=3364738 RepID=UPI0036C0F430
MSTNRRTRLAALAVLTALSTSAGVLTATAATSATVDAGVASALRSGAQAAPAPADGSATAASPILLTGQAGWGFKTSWFRYVTGLGGTVTTAGGATASGTTGVVSYPVLHGAVNPAEASADVLFDGSVTYAVPAHGITAITLAKPRVVLKDGTGTLYMDVRTELDGKEPTSATAVPFATLTAAPGSLTGSRLDWSGITTKLTAEGAQVFSNQGQPMYEPGTVLDPLGLDGTVSTPTLTVSQVSGLGAETEVTVKGSGYRPGKGVYLAQSIALPGTTYPSVFGNAAYIRQVDADGTFTTVLKLTQTFTPAGALATPVDCTTTACFVTSFNSHDRNDATWMPSRAQDVERALRFGSARVTTQPSAQTVRSGATATFRAAAEDADSVRWERSTDRGTTWSAVSGATSTTLAVKATGALNGSLYRAVFTNAAGEVSTRSAALAVKAVPSRITGLNAGPEPVAKGSKVTVTGTLQAVGATNETWRAVARTGVVVEFRAKGSTAWSRAASATTGTNGAFSAGITAAKDGDWRARYTGTADRAASTSGADYVDVRLRTAVTGLNASPEPVRKGSKITVKGTLTKLDGSWRKASNETVSIWFKADGARSWTKLASTRTNSAGAFSKGFTAKKDGSWRAVFTTNSALLGTTSSSDRVDVR